MRISRFVILFTAVFFLELILLGVAAHSIVPLVALCAFCALATVSLPWYVYLYMLVGVSLSSFLQDFSMVFTALSFGGATILSILFRNMLEHTILVQALLAVLFGVFFMWFNCTACLTPGNMYITILTVPFMIKFLQ